MTWPGCANNPISLTPAWGGGLFSLALFLLAVLGTALWSRMPRPAPQNPLFLTPRSQIPGYRFQPVTLGPRVAEILATTNLINGHFIDGRSNRVSVFQASWEPGQGTIADLFHTPEACWTSQGFEIVQNGEYPQIGLKIHGRSVRFQGRMFKHTELPLPEITIWSASLDGRWDDIVFGPTVDLLDKSAMTLPYLTEFARTVSTRWINIRRLIQRPCRQSARKQFIRFSKPVTTDWSAALTDLEHFAQAWFEAEPKQASTDRGTHEALTPAEGRLP